MAGINILVARRMTSQTMTTVSILVDWNRFKKLAHGKFGMADWGYITNQFVSFRPVCVRDVVFFEMNVCRNLQLRSWPPAGHKTYTDFFFSKDVKWNLTCGILMVLTLHRIYAVALLMKFPPPIPYISCISNALDFWFLGSGRGQVLAFTSVLLFEVRFVCCNLKEVKKRKNRRTAL